MISLSRPRGISWLLALVLVGSTIATACGAPQPQPPAATTTLLIGALVDRTGAFADEGEASQAALALAERDVNAFLTSAGSRVRVSLLVEDTQLQPAVALDKLKGLAGKGVKVAIGPMSSSEVEAVKGYADQQGILIISQSSTAPSLAVPGDNVFRFAPDDAHQAQAISRLMWEDGIRTVVPLVRSDVWGDNLFQVMGKAFKELGGTLVDGVRYSPGAKEFSRELASLSSKVSQAGAQSGVKSVGVHLTALEEVAPLLAQAQDYPVLSTVKWYGSNGTALAKGLVSNSKAARFAAATGFPSPLHGEEGENDKSKLVAGQIQEKIGRPGDAYAFAAYDAVWITALTHIATGATNDVAALKKALPQVAASYFGAGGWTILNEAGDRKFAGYDFWAVREERGAFQWKRVARYQAGTGAVQRFATEVAFPSKPMVVITGFVGGSIEFVKAISAEAQKELGVSLTTVPKVGDGGLEAIKEFHSAPKDGYTLIVMRDLDASAYAQGRIAVNPAEDWVPIIVANQAISQIYIRPNDPRYSNWDELVAYARKTPGLKVATVGTPLDMEGLSLASLERGFGVQFEQAPYDVAPERYASLVEGKTDLIIEQPGDVKAFLDSGKFKPILTLWSERVKGFENVPTAREKGIDFAPLLRTRGLAAPKGTPPERIERLRAAFQAAFKSPGFQKHLRENTLDLVSYPSDPVAAMREQVELYRKLSQAPRLAPGKEKVKIGVLIVHSYDSSFQWTRDQHKGILEGLHRAGYAEGKDYELKVFYMDTKVTYPAPDQIQQRGAVARDLVDQFKPSIVFVTDDDAFRHVAVEYTQRNPDKKLPFIFSGVNADPTIYPVIKALSRPGAPITGALERIPHEQSFAVGKRMFPNASRIAVLADPSQSSTFIVNSFKQDYADKGTSLPLQVIDYAQPRTFKEWQDKVREYQTKADILGLLNYHQLRDESGKLVPARDVVNWTLRNSKLPELGLLTVWAEDGLLIAAGNSGAKMGAYVGLVGGHVLGGKDAGTIPIVDPKLAEFTINLERARMLGVAIPDREIVDAAQVYQSLGTSP